MYKLLIVLLLLISVDSLAGHAANDEDISINIANLPEGKHVVFEWLGMPTMVLKPTKEQLQLIQKNKTQITQKDLDSAFQSYAKTSGNKKATMLYHSTLNAYKNDKLINQYPAIVILAVSPKRGCAIRADYEDNVLEDPCSGISFSLDGRPFENISEFSAPLFIPSYTIKGDYLTIQSPSFDSVIDFSPHILASDKPDKLKLFDAISWDKLNIVKILIERDKNLLAARTSVDCNVVHLASTKSKELLSYLIDKKVSTTHICSTRYTPIMLSMLMKKHDNAALLLNHGAKLEAYCEGDECAKSLLDYLEYENGYTPEYAKKLMKDIVIQREYAN
jgi:hypothetical protein